MGRRIGVTSLDFITGAALPVYTGGTYAVISHKDVIDSAKELLKNAGLTVEHELYSATRDASVARGIYLIKESTDSEIQMMFAWVNSYDKSKRFECSIGCHIKDTGGFWFSSNMGSWSRKHTGDAKKEAVQAMTDQITNAGVYYNTLISHKEQMKLVILPEKLRAELLGRIYFKDRLITSEQAGIVRTALMKPGDNTLWELVTMLAGALVKSHPKDWMSSQVKLSKLLEKEFGIGQANQSNPAQTDLVSLIAEVSLDKMDPEEEISFEL